MSLDSDSLISFKDGSSLEEKRQMIEILIKEICKRRDKHRKVFIKLKKRNSFAKVLMNVCSAISVSSLVISMTPLSPVFLIVSLVSTSIGSLSLAAVTGYQLSQKLENHARSHLLYSDLIRDYSAKLRRNHLTSVEYDDILDELNNRINLIESCEEIV